MDYGGCGNFSGSGLVCSYAEKIIWPSTPKKNSGTGACQASQFFLENKEVYANPAVFYSGPPFALHVTALSHFLADTFHLPCSGMWKMPTVFADIGIVYQIQE